MPNTSPGATVAVSREAEWLILAVAGSWVTTALAAADRALARLDPGNATVARINLAAVDQLDLSGAWLIERVRRDLLARGLTVTLDGVRPNHAALLRLAERAPAVPIQAIQLPHPVVAMVERTGRGAIDALREGTDLLSFLGVTAATIMRSLVNPARIRLVPVFSHTERVGLNAMPIVGLLSFLIGVVIAYQGADQLKRFGAEIFTVDLLGVSVLREMGILLAAIIIAGRSGSAFAAEIGTMQVSQEIDAMRTLGLDPVEILVLPRVLALIIAMPLLAVFSDLMALTGGALMSLAALDIPLSQFLDRLRGSVPIWSFWVGLIKAPFFGFVIALVGCREGLKTAGSAESVGLQTTKSVAVSIFLVILLDALFSIFFSFVGV